MSESLRLDQIEFTAGTQVREAINESVVNDYADRLNEGDTFPPVVVFHDGNRYHLADGFHRGMAHLRLGREAIAADVHVGTKEDALWFALGANKTNGAQLTFEDKRHAILLASQTWNDRSQRDIAAQIGCSQPFVSKVITSYHLAHHRPDRVTGTDGKNYPASPGNGSVHPKRAEVERLVNEGVSATKIIQQIGASKHLVAEVRKDVGAAQVDRSKVAVAERRSRMREMAAEGYTSIQIADELGINLESCRQVLRDEGIVVPADKATARAPRLDSARIVDHIVMDAENLTADLGLIDFSELEHSQVIEWVASLTKSREKLGAFIKRLVKETK